MSSCHSSITTVWRFLKNSDAFFCVKSICRLSGVIMRASGICRFCSLRSRVPVSPVRMPTRHVRFISSTAVSMFRNRSFESALSGVIHSTCKPFFVFSGFLGRELICLIRIGSQSE
ncbi:hypothetical protein D3C87_1841760 [compost metagenome]